MTERVLLLHGWQHHRPEGHWLRWLTAALRDAGRVAVYPQLPSPDDPDLDAWLEVLDTELAMLGPVDERVVVAHSLGALLWLHRVGAGVTVPIAARVLLVAPPGPSFTAARIPAFAAAGGSFDGSSVRAAAGSTRLVCSDADPYCVEEADRVYGRPLGLDVDVLPDQGHLALDDGYGPWPSALDWCCDGTVPLVAQGSGELR